MDARSMTSQIYSENSDSKRKTPQAGRQSTKRAKTAAQPHAAPGGTFQCFTVTGDDVNLHRRSAFSSKRKKEVRGIRRKGACLRCRLMKRACSGEDPCRTCIAAATAAAGSRALMWMECIRPSFQAINIFDKGHQMPDQNRINSILDDLLEDDVYLDFHIPFALNVEAASAHLASWLSDDLAPSTFSVVGVFSASTNTSLLQNALDPNLGKDLRLFVHITTYLYTTGMQSGYHQYTDEEIHFVRDCVGNRLLLALDPLLRPTELEASEDKLGKLKSLFLLLLGATVGMKYTYPEVIDEDGNDTSNLRKDPKKEALLRLLCHYLIYIGKATALLEPSSDESMLINKWKSPWNKPAAFTWNSTTGLEMHYRFQPPADSVISSTEDESASSFDIDLSELDELDEGAEFTVNADLLKCTGCGTFWSSLDHNDLCHSCQGSLDKEWSYRNVPFMDDIETLPFIGFGLVDEAIINWDFTSFLDSYDCNGFETVPSLSLLSDSSKSLETPGLSNHALLPANPPQSVRGSNSASALTQTGASDASVSKGSESDIGAICHFANYDQTSSQEPLQRVNRQTDIGRSEGFDSRLPTSEPKVSLSDMSFILQIPDESTQIGTLGRTPETFTSIPDPISNPAVSISSELEEQRPITRADFLCAPGVRYHGMCARCRGWEPPYQVETYCAACRVEWRSAATILQNDSANKDEGSRSSDMYPMGISKSSMTNEGSHGRQDGFDSNYALPVPTGPGVRYALGCQSAEPALWRAYQQHESSDANLERHRCPSLGCTRVCTREKDLRRHMEMCCPNLVSTHQDTTPYACCSWCGEAFLYERDACRHETRCRPKSLPYPQEAVVELHDARPETPTPLHGTNPATRMSYTRQAPAPFVISGTAEALASSPRKARLGSERKRIASGAAGKAHDLNENLLSRAHPDFVAAESVFKCSHMDSGVRHVDRRRLLI